MTQNNPTRRPASRAATAVAALGAAASIAVAAPGAANAAIAIPEVPEWVTQILPTPDQVKDGSASYAEFIQWLGSDDVQGALKGWNSIAGAVPGGLLPGISSETTYTNGRDEQPAGAKPGSMHFKTLFERADMKGFYDLLGKSNVGLLNIAEVLGRNQGTILDRYENVTTIDGLLFGGTTRLANSYAFMPGFKVLGQEIPEFSIWIPEAQGDYTSLFGSGFGFNNSMPTMALPGLGAIPLPHSAGYVTAPFGLGGGSYYVKTLLPVLGENGEMGLVFPAFGGALNSPFGTLGFAMDQGPSVSILDGGLGLGFGSPTFSFVDPLGTKHDVGFVLGGISYTEAGGLKVSGPDLTYTSTPAPAPEPETKVAPAEVAVSAARTASAPVVDVDSAPAVAPVTVVEPADEPVSETTTVADPVEDAPLKADAPESTPVADAPEAEPTVEADAPAAAEDTAVTSTDGDDASSSDVDAA